MLNVSTPSSSIIKTQQMPLYEPTAQLLNYAREIAVMTEEQFSNHFNGMSVHLKMTLRMNPFVKIQMQLYH